MKTTYIDDPSETDLLHHDRLPLPEGTFCGGDELPPPLPPGTFHGAVPIPPEDPDLINPPLAR